MINGLSPQYLSDLVPATIDSSSNYNLRTSNNIHLVNACTALYYNPFLLSVIRDWNNLPDDRRNVDSVIAFKNVLSRDKPIVPKHYLFGNRKEQILHTRHFFLDYPIYNNQRITLMQTVSRFCAITLDTLLYGNSTLSLQANNDKFEAVQLFLKQTNRF